MLTVFFSTLIAQAEENVFGTGLTPQGEQGGLAAFDYTQPLTSAETLISNLIGLITIIGSIIFVFMFVYGALKWITAGGDSGSIEKARNQMVQGVIGLVILVAAYAVIGLIGSVVGVDILNPGREIREIFQIRPEQRLQFGTSTVNQ